MQERSSLIIIPRAEAALDAAPESFNLVIIIESDTIPTLHRYAIKIIIRKPHVE